MSNIADLKAALIAEAANISDSIDKLECLSDIDTWYIARAAIDAFSDPTISSYSIGGRSVTRNQLPVIREQESIMLERIKGWLGRAGGGLVDHSSADNNVFQG